MLSLKFPDADQMSPVLMLLPVVDPGLAKPDQPGGKNDTKQDLDPSAP
jgi:hypothetical protein